MTVVQSTRQLDLRERLLTNGVQSLSDTELLAIFIGSGSGKKSCVQLAFDLLKHLGDLRAILNTDLQSFKQVHGLGEVRYVQLQAVRKFVGVVILSNCKKKPKSPTANKPMLI